MVQFASLAALRQRFPRIGLAHASLACAGLMWVLPFLYFYHAYPITTFYQEWGAVVLGLCAMPLLVTQRYWRQPEIPRSVLLPMGLMLLVLVQFAFGKIGYLNQALLYALYLLWAALLIMLGHRLREELGLPVLATALAAFLLLGAESNALVGVLQHYRWHTFLDTVVVVKTGSAVFGNMAQPNHFADYITLGLISLGLLHLHWRLRIWQVAVLAAPLLFVLVLSGSRSAWLYLLCMAAMAFLWQRRERKGGVEDSGNPPVYPLRVLRVLLGLQPLSVNSTRSLLRSGLPAFGTTTAYPMRVDKSCLPLLHYSLALLLGFGLMHFVVQIPWLAGSTGSVTTMERLAEEFGSNGAVTSGSIRLYIWHEAWLIFTQFPLLGAGFGQFAWQHFQLGPVLRNTGITGLYNNAHNLVLQIAAEMGLAGLLILLGALVLWLWQARRAQCSIYHWWGYGLLAVLGIHSLLEYPLWYAYFLGVAALALGMFENTTYRLELRGVGRWSIAAILLLGVMSLQQMLHGYRNMEKVLAMRPASATDSEYSNRVREKLTALYGQSLLQPYTELFMSSMIEVGADHLADRRALNESVMHFVPISPVVYREALLLALSGEQAAAQLQMERAIWSYPGDFPRASEELRTLARKDPAHFAALLEFALQKYEERQRAVHTG
ncbi:MAG: O-antigen ligase C-terminal domain-containing protein [Betaproteobacteria bacterium]|nr:O-antigen ligase C-terminal domain-containing protein [Betaproteobacteria bacterium]